MTGGYRWCFCVCVFFFGAPWEVWRCMFGFPFRNLSFHFLMGQKTNFGVFFPWRERKESTEPAYAYKALDYTHSTSLDCFKSSEVQGTIQRLKIGSFNINMFPISGCNPLQDTKTPMSLTSMRWAALVPLHWKSFNIYELRMFGRRSKFAGWLPVTWLSRGPSLWIWKLMKPLTLTTQDWFELSAIRNLTNGCWWAGCWFEILACLDEKLSLHFLVLFMD